MTRLDPVQIFRRVFDEVSKAFRMKLVDTEISMELDHKDGDSVHSVPLHKHMKGVGVLDISECRVIMVHGGSVKISPDHEDEIWVDLAEGTHQVAACRVKSENSNIYIVARS